MSTKARPRPVEILRVVREYRAALVAREAQAVARLVEDHRGLASWLDREASALEDRMRRARDAGEEIRPSWLHSKGRLDELAAQLQAETEAFTRAAAANVSGLVTDAAEIGQRAGGAAVTTAAGALSPPIVAATLPGDALTALGAVTARSAPVGAILADMAGDMGGILRGTLLTGLAAGEHPWQIARRMTRVADVPLRRARTVARTETMRAYRSANLETFRQIPQLGGWVWIAGLDGRTCGACYALHGTEHPVTEELESHPNCRCVPAPLVPDLPPLVEPGAERMARMSEEDLVRRFGPGKGRALADGSILPEDLIGVRRSPVWGVTRSEASLTGARARAAARTGRPAPPPAAAPPAAPATRARFVPAELEAAEAHLRAELVGRNSSARQAEAIAARLHGHPEYEAAARKWDTSRRRTLGDPEADYSRPGAQAEANVGMAQAAIQSWARTSSGSPFAVSMQQAARAEFRLERTAAPWNRGGQWDVSDAQAEQYRRDLFGSEDLTPFRALLRAQYEVTQEALQGAGVEKVVLVRGWSWRSVGEAPSWARPRARPEATVESVPLAPMASYTSDFRTARDAFANSVSHDDVVRLTAVEVDRSKIIGYAPHGLGTDYESEWVVLGGEFDQVAWDPRHTGPRPGDVLPLLPPEAT